MSHLYGRWMMWMMERKKRKVGGEDYIFIGLSEGELSKMNLKTRSEVKAKRRTYTYG